MGATQDSSWGLPFTPPHPDSQLLPSPSRKVNGLQEGLWPSEEKEQHSLCGDGHSGSGGPNTGVYVPIGGRVQGTLPFLSCFIFLFFQCVGITLGIS